VVSLAELTTPLSGPGESRRRYQAVRAHPDLAILALLIVVAAVPRVILQLQAPIFLVLDSSSYARPAYDLLNGAGLTTGLKRPIGYPLLLAGVFAAFGPDLMAVAAVQHALGVLTVGLTYLLGRACFGRWVGFGAAVAIAVSSPQLSLEHTILTEALFTALLVGLALTLIRAGRATGHGPAILAGVLLGLAALVKPVGQALLPLGLAFAALRPGTVRRRLLSSGLLAAAFAALVLPWMVRNDAVHGRFTVGGGLGESLLASTVDFSRGTFRFDGPDLPPEPDPARRAARRIIQDGVSGRDSEAAVLRRLRAELGLTEAEADRLAQELVFEAIQRQPLDFIGSLPGFARRLFELGHRSPALNWGSYKLWDDEDRALARLVRRPTPAQEAGKARIEALLEWYRPSRLGIALPLLALAGLAAAWRLRPLAPAIVPGLLAACLVVVQVTLDGPVARYRYPIDPFLHVLALGATWTGLRYARRLLGAGLGARRGVSEGAA
jgi:4-amino-4-deoxy-L-arabinose transferase-like glycosyltransferase